MMVHKKAIKDFSNYVITKKGKVWSNKSQKFLSPQLVAKGYGAVRLCKDGKIYDKLVHRLVLETFIGSCPLGMECRHLDGSKVNNNLENLRWGTRSENTRDSVKHGTHFTNKLTEQDVRMIIYMYKTTLFTQQEIAEIYDVRQQTVSDIVNKKKWKHIWDK